MLSKHGKTGSKSKLHFPPKKTHGASTWLFPSWEKRNIYIQTTNFLVSSRWFWVNVGKSYGKCGFYQVTGFWLGCWLKVSSVGKWAVTKTLVIRCVEGIKSYPATKTDYFISHEIRDPVLNNQDFMDHVIGVCGAPLEWCYFYPVPAPSILCCIFAHLDIQASSSESLPSLENQEL